MGNILWNFYGAHLTSVLTLPTENLPFKDLETFAQSEFTLNTRETSHALASYFFLAEKGTLRRKIFQERMDRFSSFDSLNNSIEKVLKESKQALFNFDDIFVLERPDKFCHFRRVWKTIEPIFVASFGLRKRSPYREFFNTEILKFGNLNKRLPQNYLKCPANSKSPYFEKLILPFVCLLCGIFMSLAICIMERLKT